MLYYCILTFIKLHLISTTSATTTINVFLEEKEAKYDNQILLSGKGRSIRSLASILFIKSELTYRALCAPGVILNLIS